MMLKSNQKIINAYYHPTTVVFLDDHQAFLDSIPLALNTHVAYQAFIDPTAAIDYINGHTQYQPLLEQDFLSTNNDSSYHYKLDRKSILHKTLDHKRFSEPSVLITDYAMSGTGYNGLDVCNAIENPYVKKILLTGVADEEVAIEALNNKVIDYYLKKSTQDILPKINELIRHYQQDYFNEMTRVVREGLKASSPLIDDPAVVGYFFALIRQKNIVEYHLHTELSPASLDFFMFNEQGEKHRLLLLNKEDMKVHKEVATDAGAPEALLRVLDSSSSLPLFPTLDGFYHPNIGSDWQKYCYPSTKIHGKEPYLATFIQETNTPPQQGTQAASLQQYFQDNTALNSTT
ncbi:response regulator transcription factor [Marinomonas transparens]|uniref:Response regulator transcription factor n=1 Tax=Marinomonas transparens TaxID=2795388 RepID=A0A934JPH2_9GAMM|nr:response regulator [Marinomonas transparens]MBJ7537363.1 response regulator transcription factor [Marinomonas transparens]